MKKVIVTLAVVIMALGLSTQNLKAQENNNGQNPAESGYNIGLGFHLSMDFFNPNKDLNSQLGIKTKGIGYGAGFSIFLAHQNFKAYFGFDFNHSSNFQKENSYHIYTPKTSFNLSYSFALDKDNLFEMSPHVGIGYANNIISFGHNVKLDNLSITDAQNATGAFSQTNWYIPVGVLFRFNVISFGVGIDIPVHYNDVHPLGSKDTKVTGLSNIKNLPTSLTIGVSF